MVWQRLLLGIALLGARLFVGDAAADAKSRAKADQAALAQLDAEFQATAKAVAAGSGRSDRVQVAATAQPTVLPPSMPPAVFTAAPNSPQEASAFFALNATGLARKPTYS